MPTYHFNLLSHASDPDVVGYELSDEAAARNEAIRFAGEVLREDPARLKTCLQVNVTDDHDKLIFTVETRLITPVPDPTG